MRAVRQLAAMRSWKALSFGPAFGMLPGDRFKG